jgi:hypothetical protein
MATGFTSSRMKMQIIEKTAYDISFVALDVNLIRKYARSRRVRE